MSITGQNKKNFFRHNHLDYWFTGLTLIACYFTSGAIYSPDSSSYFGIVIQRYPVYTIWMRVWEFLFTENYQNVIVILQLFLGWVTLVPLARILTRTFNLNRWLHIIILMVFIYPYFPPLWVAHNLTSEGLAYPLYLLVTYFTIELLIINRYKKVIPLVLSIILLCLTRGQFIVVPIIIGFFYFLKNSKQIKKKYILYPLILLILSPVAITILDRSYHKIIHGHFVTTPYSFVAIVTLPLYVSHLKDSTDIQDPTVREIFIKSYKTIDSLNLVSSAISGDAEDKYTVFHNNFPTICNQNIHTKARNIYLKQGYEPWENSIKAEEACRIITAVLIKNNLNTYMSIFWQGILRGFKSIYLLILLGVISLVCIIQLFRKKNDEYIWLSFSAALLFSNSLIVGIACHSIDRYLFYNYTIALLMIYLFLRKIYQDYVH